MRETHLETASLRPMGKFMGLWIAYCAFGELLGIVVAASVAVGLNLLMGEPASLIEKMIQLFAMLAAGMFEGSTVAIFQWLVLRRFFTGLLFRNWWKWTVIAAISGWLIGSIPSLFFIGQNGPSVNTEPPAVLMIGSGLLGGLILGAMFGLFQWQELRKHVAEPGWWIVANSIGWGVGLAIIMFGATWPNQIPPLPLIILSAIISGALAGISVGIATAYSLRHWLYAPLLIGSH